MPPSASTIFDRVRLTAAQLKAVANRRFADAEYLRRSGSNERANGAIYLAGFTLECLLKARLLELHPWLTRPGDLAKRSTRDRQLYFLCYRSHELAEILEQLQPLKRELHAHDQRTSGRLLATLQQLCGTWTIFARYSPRMATIRDAAEFLVGVEELKEWLR